MMISTTWLRRTAVLALAVSATLGVAPATFSGSNVSAAPSACTASDLDPDQLKSGGEFHALAPRRIFDTRNNTNDSAPIGKKATSPAASNETTAFDINVLGQGGIPADGADVLAVVVNVTVAAATNDGYLTIYPKGFDTEGGLNTSSLINFKAGTAVPNLSVLGVGADGSLTANVVTGGVSGQAHVIIDVFGWIAKSDFVDTADAGARLVPVSPDRILDTRGSSPVAAKGSVSVQVRGADSVAGSATDIVPNAASVSAVMINLTAVNKTPQSVSTFVSVTPDAPGAVAGTSSTNVPAGRNKANLAIVPVGADGKIHLYNDAGAVNLIVDVLGYFETGKAATSSDGRIIPLEAPFRAFDTRSDDFGATPLATGSVEEWSFEDFAQSVTLGGKCVGPQSALIGNLTAARLDPLFPNVFAESFLQVYPGDLNEGPITSNVNFTQGESVPNMSLLTYGSKTDDEGTDDYVVKAYNEYASLHYILDVFAIVL